MTTWVEQSVRNALDRLAADAGAQEAYLRRLGTWPLLDELALELDDVAEAFAVSAAPPVRDRIRALSGRLDEMSGHENARLWQPEAQEGPEWAEVRKLAAEALAVLG